VLLWAGWLVLVGPGGVGGWGIGGLLCWGWVLGCGVFFLCGLRGVGRDPGGCGFLVFRGGGFVFLVAETVVVDLFLGVRVHPSPASLGERGHAKKKKKEKKTKKKKKKSLIWGGGTEGGGGEHIGQVAPR